MGLEGILDGELMQAELRLDPPQEIEPGLVQADPDHVPGLARPFPGLLDRDLPHAPAPRIDCRRDDAGHALGLNGDELERVCHDDPTHNSSGRCHDVTRMRRSASADAGWWWIRVRRGTLARRPQGIDPMTKTVTSLFHSEHHATAAASHLKQAGIPADDIDIWTTPHNLAPLLEDLGVSRTDAHAYAEGVIRGGTVVIVKCDASAVDEVVGILDKEGVLDLDEQQAAWRSEGWEGPAAAEQAGDLTGSSEMARSRTDSTGAEQTEVVVHGRIRIQSRRAERPVQE